MSSYSLSKDERSIYLRYAELALPRHTSYPIAPVWKADYGPVQFRADLQDSADQRRPLSLYVHIPFCERLCYFCACTKEIIPQARRKEHDPSLPLLEGFRSEAGRLAEITGQCEVHQVHLGGGSPTFLGAAQLRRLWEVLTRHWVVAAHAEIAVEVDPRITSREQLETLRELGFNRVSLGIQDFAPHVQKAVNRLQPLGQVAQLVGWCRELGFSSVNFDLIYGLPFQTLDSMADTLDKTIALGPDRIAFYRLAVIPEIFRWQNTFRHTDLPSGELSLDLNLLAINRLGEAGYEFIGLDHFARPGEALSEGQQTGSLHRNFQGMTTGKHLDLVGLGPSAISQLAGAFAQNHKATTDWQLAVERVLATARGLRLSPDDRLRRELLQQLYGHGTVAKRTLEKQFAVTFEDYFAAEQQTLRELEGQGLVRFEPDHIRLTNPLGRLLARVVGAVFDRYLPPNAYREGLPSHLASKVG
jgi:oxygen-independent coproporphyrinogen-3 oxidase